MLSNHHSRLTQLPPHSLSRKNPRQYSGILRGITGALLILLAVDVVAADSSRVDYEELREEAQFRTRRLVFNSDSGSSARVPPAPTLTPQAFLDRRLSPLAGTQVDTIVLDTTAGSFGSFGHRTKVTEMFTSREGRYRYNVLPDFLLQNTDPLQVTIEFCRRNNIEILWGIRMNDTHDASNSILIPAFKRDHPDYLFGTPEHPPKYGRWSSVDFAQPAVRELVYLTIAEVADDYDIDGVELDFWRHPAFFKRSANGGTLRQEDLDLMTELIRRVRAKLDEVGTRQGKHLLLMVKYPDSIGYCRTLGLDIKKWLAEDLIDVLVPGGYFQFNHWEESVALGKQYSVPVHACLAESRVSDPRGNKARNSTEALRARAAAAWASGVDSIEMFNHFDGRKPYWHELGSPEILRKLPKTYFISVQGVGSSRSYAPSDAFITLPGLTPDAPETVQSGQSTSYDIFIGDDLRGPTPLNARLRLQTSETGRSTEARLSWDGDEVAFKPDGPGDFVAGLNRHTIVPGHHRIGVENGGSSDIEIEDIMIEIILQP